MEVKVTNKNPKAFSDGWHGMTFTFDPNKVVVVPLEAAIHIFGYNLKNKLATLRRLGLANHPDGEQWLSNFELEAQVYVRAEDAEEAASLKVALDDKQKEIDALNADLAKKSEEIAQLSADLKKAQKQK